MIITSNFMKASNKNTCSYIQKFGTTFLVTFLLVNVISGQNYKYINHSDMVCPLFVIICQEPVFNNMNDSILNIENQPDCAFLLINASQESSGKIRDTLNLILNEKKQIDKTKVYLIIVGDEVFFDKQKQFSNSFFPSRYFIQTDIQDTNFTYTPFKTVKYSRMNLKNIVEEQSKSHLWQLELEKIRKLSNKKEETEKKSWEIGMGYSSHFPGAIRTDDDFPRRISAFEVQISRNLNRKYKIQSSLAFNKLMLFKKKQEGTPSLNFDSEKQIMETTFFSRSLSITRLFYITPSPVFIPYLALGISHSKLSLMYMEASGNNPNMDLKQYSCGSLMITSGFEICLGSKIRLNSKISYHISLNTYNTMNDFNASIGLSYVIQHKKKPFYEYLRLE